MQHPDPCWAFGQQPHGAGRSYSMDTVDDAVDNAVAESFRLGHLRPAELEEARPTDLVAAA